MIFGEECSSSPATSCSGLLPSFPLYLFWVAFVRWWGSILVRDVVLFQEEEVRAPGPVSRSQAARQIRQRALPARLQEGFSPLMEQPNNCYYSQWPTRRSILRTIQKGKVGHQAGKKAFKPHQTQRMWRSFKHKQLAPALIQITMEGVLPCARHLTSTIISNPGTT